VRHRCIQDSVLLSSLIMVESAVHKLLGLYRRNLDRIVVPSRFYREKLMEWGWPAEQLVHIPNFIAAGDFVADYRPGDYFLYFGRLAPEKGVDKLIAAAVASGVQVKIAGSGHAEGDLRVLAGEADNVEFLGYRSGAALWELVRGSRAVVLPSQWYENAPLSILESFACGKPVIGARIGGIVELVREGETGFLFAHDDVADLADRLLAVAAMPADAVRDLGARARELVATEFTREHYVDAILALYAELGVDAPERRRPSRAGSRPLPGRRR
jgi:glycosyltransferase involved in cell wall biosynthesis